MEDQFGGRTDDDLFADDFEPISTDSQPAEDAHAYAAPVEVEQTTQAVPPAPVQPPVQPQPVEQPVAKSNGSTKSAPALAPAQGHRGLAHSKYSDNKPQTPRQPRQPSNKPSNNAKNTNNAKNANNAKSTNNVKSANNAIDANQPPAAPTIGSGASAPAVATDINNPAPRDSKTVEGDVTPADPAPSGAAAAAAGAAAPTAPTAPTAPRSEVRIKSGANPRTKLTEDELSARMEKMRILNAEKTRKFEQAEADERTHAEAYARGMEEARKRRQADEERKKRGEEERKRMDDERAKNRERKLRAMENKDGGWDLGKREEQEEAAREFRGAHGGVRGAKGVESLAGSRYARDDPEAAGDRYGGGGGDERQRGRGRGRGRGGQGRGRGGGGGGRGGGFGRDRDATHEASASNGAAAPPPATVNTDEFPALPGTEGKFSPDSPLGATNWGDEMEALDAKLAKKD